MKIGFWILLGLVFPCSLWAAEPLPQAHAHNDYLHEKPLHDAVSFGFCNVEADIFLVDGKLLVAHTAFEIDPKRTLEDLYLKPLQKYVTQNEGLVFKNGPVFTFLVDIKNQGEKTYRVLDVLLSRYAQILTRVVEGKEIPGAVQVVISGDRPQEFIEAQKIRYASIDGRISDLKTSKPAHLMPLISDRWGKHFQWRGKGEFPDHERKKLHRIVSEAHQNGRRVRFWATPEDETLWKELKAAKVDLINTDELKRLQQFLLDNSQ